MQPARSRTASPPICGSVNPALFVCKGFPYFLGQMNRNVPQSSAKEPSLREAHLRKYAYNEELVAHFFLAEKFASVSRTDVLGMSQL